MSDRRYVSPFAAPEPQKKLPEVAPKPAPPSIFAPAPSATSVSFGTPPDPSQRMVLTDDEDISFAERFAGILAAPVRIPPEYAGVPAEFNTKGRTLCEQIGVALKPYITQHTLVTVAKEIGVTTNTVSRIVSGVGMKLSTLEKMCRLTGWTIQVTDKNGDAVALFQWPKKNR